MNAASQTDLRRTSKGRVAMATGGRKALFELSAGIVAVGLVTLATLGPASAQGIFESIFGGLRRTIERPTAPLNVHAFAEPFTSLARAITSRCGHMPD
jgi:hypothetical protein